MEANTIFYIILFLTTFDFIRERVLGYLNRQSSSKPIPKELDGVYDDEKYRKSQEYQRVVGQFGNFSASLSFLLTFSAIFFGWFGWLQQQLDVVLQSSIVSSLAFFGVLFIVSDLIGTPFSIYRNFVIEERFGFNKMTGKTYVLDKIKGYVLTIVIGGGLLTVFLTLVERLGVNFWWYFWAIIVVFILGANMFYTTLILPLFNKLTPMPAGELKESIESFSRKVNFPLTNIFVMDGSKRSSKGNAFFSGLGRKKKVVLFDTLIEKHTTEELTAVFAHEVGHYKKKHIYLSTVLSIIQIGLMLYLMSLLILNEQVSVALGGNMVSVPLNILAFSILFSPVSHALSIGMNIISRKNEYEADEYAVKNYQAEPLIEGLKKLSSDQLSNLTPHPLFVFFNYSHPPLLQRVRAMKRVQLTNP